MCKTVFRLELNEYEKEDTNMVNISVHFMQLPTVRCNMKY